MQSWLGAQDASDTPIPILPSTWSPCHGRGKGPTKVESKWALKDADEVIERYSRKGAWRRVYGKGNESTIM